MEVEITSYIEDTDIIQSVSEYQQSKVLENIFEDLFFQYYGIKVKE